MGVRFPPGPQRKNACSIAALRSTLLKRLNSMRNLLRFADMFHYVYILQSSKYKKLYIGYSRNLLQRIDEHNKGLSQATKPYIPYKLICYEAFLSQKDAKNREVYLKTGYGLRSIKKMLREGLNL